MMDELPPDQNALFYEFYLENYVKAERCLEPLRRIAYRDPDTGKHYVILTNNFRLSARTIAAIYKERWQIELFFKLIKQNLKR